jgi:hypothetical protein
MNSIELSGSAAGLRLRFALPGSPWATGLLGLCTAVCVRLARVERRLRVRRAVNRLQQRAQDYAASQPGFAADLQAACEARDER